MITTKECKFCKENVVDIDPLSSSLVNFLTSKGKILPRRLIGLCSKHQRKLKKAIKRARNLGVLPYVIK